jgi:hypothetical protein
MSIRDDLTIDWSASPRIIEVAAPSALLRCQDLHDTLRSLAAMPEAMDEDEIVDSSGKEVVGAGVAKGITVTLLNAKVRFAARPGPDTIQCIIYQGTLVTADQSIPVAPSAYTHVVVINEVGGVIATASGNVEEIAAGVWNQLESLITLPNSIGLRIKALLDAAVSSRAASGGAMTLTPTERTALTLAIWHLADEVEAGTDPITALRRIAAISAGKVSGGPAHPDFKGIGVDTVRVHMDADADGNRTAVLFDP